MNRPKKPPTPPANDLTAPSEPASLPTRPPPPVMDDEPSVIPPLAETIRPAITGADRPLPPPMAMETHDNPLEQTMPGVYLADLAGLADGTTGTIQNAPHVALGETLQLVRYARRADTLLINGVTPHGRRLTFEQREDRQGWYVVAAGRRRRPTQRELGLVVATITQEMEAALIPERQSEVRSAYRLAVATDQPGMRVAGLEAYRDVLLDEAVAFRDGQSERLAVASIEYQAFKRFAIRHGHRIGAAFVQALGERLSKLFEGERQTHLFHKTGKAFRVIFVDHTYADIQTTIQRVIGEETRQWLVERVWGEDRRTHPDEVNFHVGIATAYPSERESNYASLAQRLFDDAHRASKMGQLKGHTSLALAKSDYRTTVYRWNASSENELNELAAEMDDGPADVRAEMSDYLHELVQADLEGMAVAGDLNALIFCAIARDGFWQGTTAMRIAGQRLVRRFLDQADAPEGELEYVGGFDLGDEFYAIAVEDDALYFARGDINSAGATRVRAGLDKVQHAVGWKREDGAGVVGTFLGALENRTEDAPPLIQRIRDAAKRSHDENAEDERLHVNDAVDIAEYLYRPDGVQASGEDIVEGAELTLLLPEEPAKKVSIVARRSGFLLRLKIDENELAAAISDSISGPQVKLRLRDTVASAAVCVVKITRSELNELLDEVREDNMLSDDHPVDVIGFLRHVADILLEFRVKAPAKIHMALGSRYDPLDFVGAYSLEDLREKHPGLFYEAVHHDLLGDGHKLNIDRELKDLVGQTMLRSLRPMRLKHPSNPPAAT